MTAIKFGTDGWRAIIAQDYTTDNVARVAKATADWLNDMHDSPVIAIGYDCRFGGSLFAETAIRVFCEQAVNVIYDPRFVSTPMISLATNRLKCHAGIIITASHNPPSYNGYKIKSHFGGPAVPADITEVEKRIPESHAIPETSFDEYKNSGMIKIENFEDLYFKEVEAKFDLTQLRNSNFGIAYDAMFGAGQQIFKRIIPKATMLHADYNPSFLGQAPEPLHKNLRELSDVIKKHADLHVGIATDGDADRIGMYDENGNFIDAHHIILILIHILHQYKKMTGKVVVAFSVSNKIKKLCEAYGIEYQVTKIGFKYICQVMLEEDVMVGGEESGGIAVKGHIPERDGIWDGLVILEYMAMTGKTMSQIIDEIYEVVGPFSYNRSDLHITDKLKKQIMANCENGTYKAFGDFVVQNLETIDGYKFYLGNDGETVMIRPSGTEPVLRVYAEGPSPAKVQKILDSAKATLLG